MMNMYEVQAKCGHVGKNRYTVKIFAVWAENGREAANIVRWYPRVKHDKKDAILRVTPIDTERFNEIHFLHMKDPYFRCRNIQEQRSRCIVEAFEEKNRKVYSKKKDVPKKSRLNKNKNDCGYMKYTFDYTEERWAG